MISFDLAGGLIMPKIKVLSIPYQGSKRAIALRLFEQMFQVMPKAKYFYDLCGGGGAMSFTAMQLGLKTVYNEYNPQTANFMRFIFDRIALKEKAKFGIFPDEYYEFITRERFFELRDQDSNYAEFSRLIYSFGNDRRSYLFNKEIEGNKHLCHDIVVFGCEKSRDLLSGILSLNIPMPIGESINDRRLCLKRFLFNDRKITDMQNLQNLQNLQRLENLGRLQNLQNLQRLENLGRLQRLDIQNECFTQIHIDTPIDETIIYLDPPYKGTTDYGHEFDHKELYEYLRSSPYHCFISEYDAPFNPIYELEKRRLRGVNTKGQAKAIEKLYYNKA